MKPMAPQYHDLARWMLEREDAGAADTPGLIAAAERTCAMLRQGLEGLGQSAPLPLGNQLAVAPVVSAARQVLVAFTAEGGQWAARAWGAGENRGGATLAEPRLLGQSVRLRPRPLAWSLRPATAGNLPEVLVVLASGPPRLLPWQTTR